MSEKTYKEKYDEQKEICNRNIAIIRPFLKEFAEKHDEGSGFYEDIIVLRGPGITEYDDFCKNHRDLFARWKLGEVSIFNIKWSGVTFVLKYKLENNENNMRGENISSFYIHANASMIYKHKLQPIDLKVATAVKELYTAQEYCSALYDCIREQERQ